MTVTSPDVSVKSRHPSVRGLHGHHLVTTLVLPCDMCVRGRGCECGCAPRVSGCVCVCTKTNSGPAARVPDCRADTTLMTLDLTTPPCPLLRALIFHISNMVLIQSFSCKLLGLVCMIFPKTPQRQHSRSFQARRGCPVLTLLLLPYSPTYGHWTTK